MPGKISSIIVKLAAPCNLNCRYCYVYNHEDKSFLERPKFISDRVFERMLEGLREYCDRHAPHSISLTFHGGEPTLIGPERFEALASRAAEVLEKRLSGMSIQTNGTLLDGRWIEVLRRHRVSIGLSLDGPPSIHDSVRVDHTGGGSHAATLAGLALLQKGGLQPGILCVVNPRHSGLEAYRHFRSLGIKRMDFLLPDVSHDNKDRFYENAGPTPVADYLIPVFDAWFSEDNPEIVIRLFWDLLQRLFGGPGDTDAFGNPLMSYLIVETDGSIEALDALRVCKEGIGRSGLNVLQSGFDDLEIGLPLVYQAVHQGIRLCRTCEVCKEREICGGGYAPHRYARANGFDNPSVWCADILKLLSHLRRRIDEARAA